MSKVKGSPLKLVKPLKSIKAKGKDPILQAVLSFREYRMKITVLTSEQKIQKEILEDAAAKAPNGQILTEEYKIVLSTCEGRAKFDLEAAIAALGEDTLKPFMSQGQPYTTLKVS